MIKGRIEDDTKAALLGGDRVAIETLRGLKAALLNEEVALGVREAGLSDEQAEKVIAREVKKRRESARMYRDNDRAELAESEEAEIEILSRYLPKQLSDEELNALVCTVIDELGASGPQAMGQVIGAVKQRVGTAVDGARLAQTVKTQLSK
ncbi:GatB/YqeY [Candidatus Saccharibacteria bacterium]|nr:MAG: GatB/YqeY [Candidatus Saccharibacteria bacterium]